MFNYLNLEGENISKFIEKDCQKCHVNYSIDI